MIRDYFLKKIKVSGVCNSLKKCSSLFAVHLLVIAAVAAQTPEKESILKAAYIYNFTKYIDWDSINTSDFTIGVIGNSSIYEPLNDIASTKTVNDKKIIVRRFYSPAEIAGCNILFISSDIQFSIFSILSKTGKGTLTISETPGYAKMGTALNFVIVNDKLKFEANVKSIMDEGLKASSQLLKLAIIVD